MMPPMDMSGAGDPSLPLGTPSERGTAGGAGAPHHLLIPPGGRQHIMPLPPALSAPPNALTLLMALRRRWLLALTVGLLVAVPAAAMTWYSMPAPKYIASRQLHVAPIPPHRLFRLDLNEAELEKYKAKQAYLIGQRLFLASALRAPGVANLSTVKAQTDQIRWLQGSIWVDFPSQEYMGINVQGDRPDELLVLVNALADTYLEEVSGKDQKTRKEKMQKMEALRDDYEARIKRKQKQLNELEANAGNNSAEVLDIERKLALEDLEAARRELAGVRSELRKVKVELGMEPGPAEETWPEYAAALSCFPAPHLPLNLTLAAVVGDISTFSPTAPGSPSGLSPRESADLETYFAKDSFVGPLLERIAVLEDKIKKAKAVSAPGALEKNTKNYQRELTSLKKQVQERRAELTPELIKELRQADRDRRQAKRKELQRQLVGIAKLERALYQDVRRLDKETTQVRKSAVGADKLQDQIDRLQNIVDQAVANIDVMEVEQDVPPRITPFGDAVLDISNPMKRKMMMSGGVGGGALAVILLGFAWLEFRSRKVHAPEEVVQGLGMYLVGTVPDLFPRTWLSWLRPGRGTPPYTQRLLTESVDATRTLVLHTAQAESLQIVMVTSAVAGEGKTSLASHLAASLARAGHRTLLLDCDLRNPTLHRLFDMERAPGLSELLRGSADLSGVIRPTVVNNLWLISAGQSDMSALQALARDGIRQLFTELRQQYDFIVVDSCPVLPVADSLQVGQHVDAVIFSLLRGVSRLPRVYAAYRRLVMLGIHILGVVVNGTREEAYASSEYYLAPESEPVSTGD